jgi:hypothetical protein
VIHGNHGIGAVFKLQELEGKLTWKQPSKAGRPVTQKEEAVLGSYDSLLKSYAAFNLVWAIRQNFETSDQHLAALRLQSKIIETLDQEIFDTPLADWLTLMTPKEFKHWYDKNRNLVNSAARAYIDEALSKIQQNV